MAYEKLTSGGLDKEISSVFKDSTKSLKSSKELFHMLAHHEPLQESLGKSFSDARERELVTYALAHAKGHIENAAKKFEDINHEDFSDLQTREIIARDIAANAIREKKLNDFVAAGMQVEEGFRLEEEEKQRMLAEAEEIEMRRKRQNRGEPSVSKTISSTVKAVDRFSWYYTIFTTGAVVVPFSLAGLMLPTLAEKDNLDRLKAKEVQELRVMEASINDKEAAKAIKEAQAKTELEEEE